MLKNIYFILILTIFISKIKYLDNFKNYSSIPNFLIYEFNNKLYKFDKNQTNKFHIPHQNNIPFYDKIQIKHIEKKNGMIDINKECNLKKANKNFKFINCKNKCNFVNTIDKFDCKNKCNKLDDFDINQCLKKLHNRYYTIN